MHGCHASPPSFRVPSVIPADAGIQGHKNNRFLLACFVLLWIPACAGMTEAGGNDDVRLAE